MECGWRNGGGRGAGWADCGRKGWAFIKCPGDVRAAQVEVAGAPGLSRMDRVAPRVTRSGPNPRETLLLGNSVSSRRRERSRQRRMPLPGSSLKPDSRFGPIAFAYEDKSFAKNPRRELRGRLGDLAGLCRRRWWWWSRRRWSGWRRGRGWRGRRRGGLGQRGWKCRHERRRRRQPGNGGRQFSWRLNRNSGERKCGLEPERHQQRHRSHHRPGLGHPARGRGLRLSTDRDAEYHHSPHLARIAQRGAPGKLDHSDTPE